MQLRQTMTLQAGGAFMATWLMLYLATAAGEEQPWTSPPPSPPPPTLLSVLLRTTVPAPWKYYTATAYPTMSPTTKPWLDQLISDWLDDYSKSTNTRATTTAAATTTTTAAADTTTTTTTITAAAVAAAATTTTNITAAASGNRKHSKLKRHSVERIYFRQRCFDASKPRVAAAIGSE